jgi:hypothetical protein
MWKKTMFTVMIFISIFRSSIGFLRVPSKQRDCFLGQPLRWVCLLPGYLQVAVPREIYTSWMLPYAGRSYT